MKGPDSIGIKNATVSVLPVSAGATSHYVRTDSTANWSLLLDGTAPTYTVTVTALGLAPQKLTARRAGDGRPIVVDVQLKHATVRISSPWLVGGQVARRPRWGGGIGTAAPPTCTYNNLLAYGPPWALHTNRRLAFCIDN